MPVATVIENLEDLSVDEVMEQFDVTREQINAVLDFVARSLKRPCKTGNPRPLMLILFDHGTPRGLGLTAPSRSRLRTRPVCASGTHRATP